MSMLPTFARATKSHFFIAITAFLLLSCVILCSTNVNAQDDPTVNMDGVHQLTADNFDQYVGTPTTAALVVFYAPWCGHCKNMADEYALLGKALLNATADKGKVILGKVDATAESTLATQYKVNGYPTIYFFPAGSNESEEYSGGRSADDFVKFLKSKIENLNIVVQREPETAKDISANELMKIINKGKKDVMVMFYAPWCGFCKQFKPMYEKLAKIYENDDDDLLIVKVNADDAANRQKLSAFAVHGFPTLMFVPRGDVNGTIRFEGDRQMEALLLFINKHANKFRLLDGDLSWKYGIDEDLAKSVAAVMTAKENEGKDDSNVKKALDAVKALIHTKATEKNHSSVDVKKYLTIAERIVSNGINTIETDMNELKAKLNSTKVGKARDLIAAQLNIISSIKKALK